MKQTTWPERHLNWTWFIIAYSVGLGVAFLGGAAGAPLGLSFLISATVFVLITIWYLKKKNRKLWNVLWLLFPFGMVILLVLKNLSDDTLLDEPANEFNPAPKPTKKPMTTAQKVIVGLLIVLLAVIFVPSAISLQSRVQRQGAESRVSATATASAKISEAFARLVAERTPTLFSLPTVRPPSRVTRPQPLSPTPVPAPVSAAEPTFPAHFVTYTDEAALFSIAYPSDWETVLHVIEVLFIAGLPIGSGWAPNLSVTVEPLEFPDMTHGEYVSELMRGVNLGVPDHRVIARTKATVDGRETSLLEHRGTFPGVGAQTHVLQSVTIVGQNGWIVTLTSLPREYGKWESDFNAIARSLRILKAER